MKVEVLAGATTKFGELWNLSPRDLVKEVVLETIKQSNIKPNDIQAIFVGNMLSSSLGGQDHLGAFFAEELGLTVPAVKLEGACASGGLAVHSGVIAVSSGLYDTVLVIGVEKMTDHRPEEVAKALMGAGSDTEREAGATFPALYALMAKAHMARYGTTEADMAQVSVKNHYHASLNSHSHFTNPITIEKVLASPVVSSPLKLLDCSPITDGAAAIIISSKFSRPSSIPQAAGKFQSSKLPQVNIIASCVATDTLGLAERDDLTSLKAIVEASNKAYQMAGVSPNDIEIAEVHDCFTIAEIIAMEDLGFFKKGQAASAISSGATTLGALSAQAGKPVVNTSGGLKAGGHPIGATGVKQIVEIYQQLTGQAYKRQVEGAQLGLTHNVGGSGGTAVVHILKSFK